MKPEFGCHLGICCDDGLPDRNRPCFGQSIACASEFWMTTDEEWLEFHREMRCRILGIASDQHENMQAEMACRDFGYDDSVRGDGEEALILIPPKNFISH